MYVITVHFIVFKIMFLLLFLFFLGLSCVGGYKAVSLGDTYMVSIFGFS